MSGQWIFVNDAMPTKTYEDIGDEVLVMVGYPYDVVTTMKFRITEDGKQQFYTGGWGMPLTEWTRHITHWMPLPEPPQVTE